MSIPSLIDVLLLSLRCRAIGMFRMTDEAGGDDACGLDEVNAPQTNPTLMSIDEEELAMQAAMDCIDDPDLLPGDAAVRRGLKRGQANWVGILRRKILDGGTIDRLPVKSATQTRYL